jgi:hypothetical protein
MKLKDIFHWSTWIGHVKPFQMPQTYFLKVKLNREKNPEEIYARTDLSEFTTTGKQTIYVYELVRVLEVEYPAVTKTMMPNKQSN